MSSPIDVNALLEETREQVKAEQGAPEDSFEGVVHAMFEKALAPMNDSLAAMHVGMRILGSRLDQLEKYVSFLLENDPTMGPKIKDHLAKMATEEKSSGPL